MIGSAAAPLIVLNEKGYSITAADLLVAVLISAVIVFVAMLWIGRR